MSSIHAIFATFWQDADSWNGMELALQLIDLSKGNEDHPYSSTQLCKNYYSVSTKTTFSFLKDNCVAATAFLKVLSTSALLMAFVTDIVTYDGRIMVLSSIIHFHKPSSSASIARGDK